MHYARIKGAYMNSHFVSQRVHLGKQYLRKVKGMINLGQKMHIIMSVAIDAIIIWNPLFWLSLQTLLITKDVEKIKMFLDPNLPKAHIYSNQRKRGFIWLLNLFDKYNPKWVIMF